MIPPTLINPPGHALSAMELQEPKLQQIWQQKIVPVVFCEASSGCLWIRLPYAKDNRSWLKNEHRHKPKWQPDQKYWIIPRAWFDDIIHRCLSRFGSVYVIQPHRERQKCAPVCWNAKGFHCECSCLGARHGSGRPSDSWYVISETCAVKWGESRYSCRLLKVPMRSPVAPSPFSPAALLTDPLAQVAGLTG